MRRAAPTLPVTPAMIRHFAVVTLVATVCLAIFASGENASALKEAQEAKRARTSGIWGTTPRKADEASGQRAVNGMNVAAGTKLDHGGEYDPDPEMPRFEQQDWGDIRNLDPDLQSLAPGSVGLAAKDGLGQAPMPGGPAPMLRDPSGIPIPGQRTGAGQLIQTRAKAPRKASEEEVRRMLEASQARSSKGNGSASPDAESFEDD